MSAAANQSCVFRRSVYVFDYFPPYRFIMKKLYNNLSRWQWVWTSISFVMMLALTTTVKAQPFNCAAGAPVFITYGTTETGLYSHNPATGITTTVKSSLLTSGVNRLINGIGYNRVDNYLWGHVSGTNQIVRIGSDGSTTTYFVTGLPVGTYTLGDVSPTGLLYLATASASSPIYRIDLNANQPYTAVASPAVSTNGLLDWAMSPLDGLLYAMDATTLYRYDPATGSYVTLGATGIDGNASSQTYFDAAGNLYATGNGGTFRIASPNAGAISSTFYARNSLSIGSNSDAARCSGATLPALAPQPVFSCGAGSPAYMVGINPSLLYSYNPITGVQMQIGTTALLPGSTNVLVDALGYNTRDNYLYASRRGTNQIVRIGSDGSAQTFVVAGLPADDYQMGDISPAGVMYLHVTNQYNNNTPLYSINLAAGPPFSATAGVQLNTAGIYDWTYNPTDNKLYGVDSRDGRLYTYSPTGAGVTLVGQTGLPVNSTTWYPFFDSAGNIYFMGPDGTYRINRVSANSFTAYQYSTGAANTTQSYDIASCRAGLPDKPVANPESVTTVGSTAVVINVAANDTPDPAYAGTTINPASVMISTQPSSGTITVNPTSGLVTFTPAPGVVGDVTFQYTIKDNNGLMSNPATVTVTVIQKPWDCPTSGIIIGNDELYLFDLTTGTVAKQSGDMGNINGIGYNYKDNYVWGVDDDNTMARVGSDGSVVRFTVPGLEYNNMGDISKDGIMYQGSNDPTKMQVINLDPASPGYLTRTVVNLTGAPANLYSGTDWSISPIDGKIYTVTSNRQLYRVDPNSGAVTLLGVVTAAKNGGNYSTFMDNTGNMYLQDGLGATYRLAKPNTGNLTATLFSKINVLCMGDGARCSNAALPPVATDDVATTAQNTPVAINVLSNDTPGSSPIDPTKVRLIDPDTSQPVTTLTVPGQGAYSVNPTSGLVTFTPASGYTGTTTPVRYTNTDQNDLVSNQATITVTVSVTAISMPNPDNNVTYVNVPVPGNVKTNDQMPAGTTYGTPTASTGNPAGGTISLNPDGTYNFTGTTPGSYTYTVPVCALNQTINCPTTPLVIKVLPSPATNPIRPAPPVANIDVTSTKGDPNTPSAVTLDVRANDKPTNPGGTLSNPTIVTQPTHGTASVDPSGNIVYKPTPGYYGDDILTYQVCESPSGLCTTTQEVIHVLPPNSPNTTLAADDYVATSVNTPVSGNVKPNDTDPEGNTQTVSPQTTTTSAGSLTLNADGSFRFVPTTDYSGPASFVYTTCDNGSPQACTNATLYILVAPQLPVPDLTPTIYARGSTVYGTSPVTVVVDLDELLNVATRSPITVKLSKEALVNLSFAPTASSLGGRSVQNSLWSFDGSSDPDYYILTTNTTIPASGLLSFGLSGTLTPGGTSGTLTFSAVIVGGSGRESRINNNVDADKIDYFQR